MKSLIPILLLVFTMLAWAANFHLVKIALDYYSPLGVASWRFLFGTLALILILYIQVGKKFYHFNFTNKEWGYLFLTSFFGIFLTVFFFNQGLKTTSAINGSLIIATSPAITAIFNFLFNKKKLNEAQWFAIALSFFGVALILVKGDLGKLAHLSFEIGDLYILMMAIVFSLSQIIVGAYLAHVNATVTMMISALMALPLFVIFSYGELLATPIPVDLPFWGSILFMGIASTAFAYVAFYYCVVKVGPTTSTLYMNLIPFFTVLLAFPFGEKLYGVQVIGGAIIIAGLLTFGYFKTDRGSRKLRGFLGK